MRSVIVPGVPTMTCAVTFETDLGRWSLIAYSVCTGVNLPIATTTDMICRASSRDGARQRACGGCAQCICVSSRTTVRVGGRRTCGLFSEKSTRLSIVSTNAAVLPVPDCDCPIMFCGLARGRGQLPRTANMSKEAHARVREEQRQGALLDLGRLREAHVVDALEQVLVTEAGEPGRVRAMPRRILTDRVARMS